MSYAAVYIRNANKSYDKYNKVLADFSMTVSQGSIYGLLGASGCGKTTLLSCIVGRNHLNSGEIWIFGGKPGTVSSGVPGPNVGYMPQEIALCSEFTVKEAVYYFGRLMGMPEEIIKPRFAELQKLLDLPPKKRYVKECSGGQQRRVSLAAALIHSPKLLILDEPTAGVDPLLRERIWKFLKELTQKYQTTVIITTHYIEETRNADMIGLMRGGKLLAEASPNNLLNSFRAETLEEVFLQLCQRQERGIVNSAFSNTDEKDVGTICMKDLGRDGYWYIPQNELFQQLTTLEPEADSAGLDRVSAFSVNKYRLKALMDKNWKQFYRNVSGWVFLLFILPIVCSAIFVFVIGTDLKDLDIAVVNNESFCGNISITETVVPDENYNCHMENVGCRFLAHLENDPLFIKTSVKNLDEALQGIRNGEYKAAIYIAKNFSLGTEMRLFYGDSASDEIIDLSKIKSYLDMSDYIMGHTMQLQLTKVYLKFLNSILKDCKYDNFLDTTLRQQGIYGSTDARMIEDMVPGYFLTFVSYMATMLTAQIIIAERLEGVWDRSAVAGVTVLEILGTHFFLQFFVMAIQMVEVYLVCFVVHSVDIVGNVWLILLMGLLQGISGMCYGFLVSIYCYENFFAANIMISGSFYPMVLICGTMWPVQAQPTLLRWVSNITPFTLPAESFRFIMKKGWDLTHFEVLKGVVIECVWILIFTLLCIFVLKKKQ